MLLRRLAEFKGCREKLKEKVFSRDGIFKLLRSPENDSKARQSMYPGGPVRQPYAYSVPRTHILL